MYDEWPRNKPLLIVADSSCSTQFANTVIEDLVRYRHGRRTAWLTAGSGSPATSAIVVSDDDKLVNHDERTNLGYSIFGGLLPQSLMRMIVYTDLDCPLDEVGRVLREGWSDRTGIEADTCESVEWSRDLSLRDLFGGRIDPDWLVGIEGRSRRFREIIPPGPRLDDVGRFLGRSSGSGEGIAGFVRVRRNELGVIEEVERGYLLPGHPILAYLLNRDPPPPPNPSYVPVDLIVPVVLKELHRRGGKFQPVPVGCEFDDRSGDLMDYIDELNQINPRHSNLFSEIALWSYGISVEEVCEIIREAREAVAGRLGIDLNGHDISRASWIKQRRPPRADAHSKEARSLGSDGRRGTFYWNKMKQLRAVVPGLICIMFLIVCFLLVILWLCGS
jgi:hypothetical protein